MDASAYRTVREIVPYRRSVVVASPAAAAWAVWASGPGWTTPALAVAALAGVALWAVDAATHRLPDAITYPATVVVILLLAGAAALTGNLEALGRAGLGALVLAGCYLLLHLIDRAGLGLGDVKLAVMLGGLAACYGWPVLWATAVVPFLLGGVTAIAMIVLRRATRTTAIAFGPFMLAGTALAISIWRITGG